MTRPNWKRQAGLAAALFVLGLFAYWVEYKHKPEKESSEELSKKVFSLKDTPIQAIKIANGPKKFEITCADFASKLCKPGDNSKWQLGVPLQSKADDSNVNSLLSTLNNLNASDTIDLKEETPEKRAALLKEYGLDPQSRASSSARSISVTTGSGSVQADLGLTHPIGDGIFVLLEKSGKADESRVYVIPSYFKSNLEHDLTYWRDKKLFAFAAHDVTGFKLDGTKAHLSAERKEGQWTLHTGPNGGGEELTGDGENMDNLLNSVTLLGAKDFVSDDKNNSKSKSTLAGAKPSLTLVLQREKGSAKEAPEPITLKLFEKGIPSGKKGISTGKLYATVSNADPLYELEAYSKERVDKSLQDLRLTKLITSMDRFTAKRLEFAGPSIGSPALLLTQVDAKWLIQPDRADADGDKVQATLDKLSGNRIKEFLSGKAIPSGQDEGLKVTLGDEKSDKKRELVFWKAGANLYARDLGSKRNEAFLVDPAIKDDLPWDRNFYKKTASGSDKPKR